MNVIRKIKFRLKRWVELVSLKKYMQNHDRMTSISDNGYYPSVCLRAARNEKYFKKFRSNSIYNEILEHVSQKQGEEYLHIIETRSSQQDRGKFSEGEWKTFVLNDLYGNPRKYLYSIGGNGMKISPTTLRYTKVLQDILLLFDSENIATIAEIGIGYGGQGRIIMSKLNIVEYLLFDLPEVLELAQKFLSNYENEDKFSFIDGTKLSNVNRGGFDLVISNYAFSELLREVQDIYLDQVISKAKRGYLTWNNISKDGYSVEELLKKIPNSHIIPEEPLTFKENCIIVWGDRIKK